MTISPSVPRHIAVIMDGNGRWAKRRLLPRSSGHKAGGNVARDVIKFAHENGIKVLTLFAFGSDNWRRPESEVSFLMDLFLRTLNSETEQLHKNNIRIKFIGQRLKFNKKLQEKILYSETLTANNTGLTLVIAANYSGQWDICQAAQTLSQRVRTGELLPENITPESIARELSLREFPDPDLLIRTSGEQRISNFFLWQLAYTELYFSEKMWPEFTVNDFQAAIAFYQSRERRFGLISEQVEKEYYA